MSRGQAGGVVSEANFIATRTMQLLAKLDRQLRLSTPYFLDLKFLKEHFPHKGEDWIKAAARRWAGYTGRRGQQLLLTQDQVIRIHQGVKDDGADAAYDIDEDDRPHRRRGRA